MSSTPPSTSESLLAENAELRSRLEEAQETLRAIGAGEVDAFVVDSSVGPQVFILQDFDTSSNHFRSDILSKVTDAVVAIDDDRRVIYLNAAAEKQYGTTSSDALGRPISELFNTRWLHPDHETLAMQALQTEGHWLGELVHEKRSGESIHVESSVSRMIGKEGSPSGLLSVIRDVTSRRANEDARRESDERYRTLFESIDEGFCVVQMLFDSEDRPFDYRFLEVSPSFAKQTGLEAVCGRTMLELVPNHEPHWFEMYGKVARDGEAVRFIDRADALDRWYDVYAFRFGEPANRQVAVLFNDITHRKRAEEALRLQAEELAHEDRMKDEFLAMLAHELRNPLAPLRNASEILQLADTSPRERAQAQRLIGRQIENMTRLIDDLLDVSRITQGKVELRRQAVMLQPILNSAASLVRDACATRGQQLTVALPSEPVYLHADPTRLEQVFGNLLGNACKYGGEGCNISLSSEVDKDTDEVVIRIADDGIGIDPELLPRIFDLFVQASRTLDRSNGGLGIGLTIVHRLVKMHEGRIEARSEGLGHGAEFIVRLPLYHGPLPDAPLPSSAGAKRGLRMLIVDDNRDSAESMGMLQELSGHETRVAHNGSDALVIASSFRPQVVLLDIGLPGMDGYEVARRLRAMPALEDTFLIALTGYGTEDDRTRALDSGFNEHLVKPADLNFLRTLLASLT